MISMKKMKRNGIFFFVAFYIILFYSPSNSKAQTIQDTPQTTTESSTGRTNNVENRKTIRDNRQNVPGSQVKENLPMRKENVDTRKEIRSEKQIIRSEKRKQFQDKITAIKDGAKKAIVERLDDKFTALNLRQTTRMKERLDRLASVVSRLQDRIAQLKANGQDTTSAETAIAEAQKAIEISMIAVDAQASKEYVPQIASESTLGQTVGITSQQLKTDLTATHKTVITAHQAVVKAHQSIVALRKLPMSPTKGAEITEAPIVETPTIIPSISSVQ